jgi:hypothetical protein
MNCEPKPAKASDKEAGFPRTRFKLWKVRPVQSGPRRTKPTIWPRTGMSSMPTAMRRAMAVAPTWTLQFAVNKRQLLENRSPIGSVAAVCVGGIGEIGGIGVIGLGF